MQLALIKNCGANAMTFATGAVNGYDLFGSATGEITLPPNAAVMLYGSEGIEEADATHKTIDITGTGTQQYEIILVAG